MTAAKTIFYSISPYGTGDIKTGTPNIVVSSGIATLSTEQTGNIGVGCAVEYNSLKSFIAPNRIPFNSGSSEIQIGDKIQGATSSATGVVRAITLDSGTWGGGDAAGHIYCETTTGNWQSGENIDIVKPDARDSSNVATTSGTLQGNIGNGNTEFVLLDKDGADAANQSSVAVTSIHHEYSSLNSFQNGFTDSDHIDSTDLSSTDIEVFGSCYYDHDDQTEDSNDVSFDTVTTDVDNRIIVFTPTGNSESVNSQRHSGVWDSNKYILSSTGRYDRTFRIRISNVICEGLQISQSYASDDGTSIAISVDSGAGNVRVSGNIIRRYGYTGDGSGINFDLGAGGHYIYNNIIYDFDTGVFWNFGSSVSGVVYGNTICDCTSYNVELRGSAANNNMHLKNNLCQGGTTADYYLDNIESSGDNISEDATSPDGAGFQNISVAFEDEADDDFRLSSAEDGNYEGSNLSTDTEFPIWRDVALSERADWDIGAFEILAGEPEPESPDESASSSLELGGDGAIAVGVGVSLGL